MNESVDQGQTEGRPREKETVQIELVQEEVKGKISWDGFKLNSVNQIVKKKVFAEQKRRR